MHVQNKNQIKEYQKSVYERSLDAVPYNA